MRKYTLAEHFHELKRRLLFTFALYFVVVAISYIYSDLIFEFLLKPLNVATGGERKVIYTGLAEAFVTYLKLALYAGLFITIPFLALQVYLFMVPGLYDNEKKIVKFCLLLSPILFYAGSYFLFFYVIPQAWQFFLSFENVNNQMPILLEARISEYLSLVLQLVTAFGFAFQLPIIMVILNVIGLVNSTKLKNYRRFAIVFIFVLAAILTPPDVLSQIALALPLMLLYEISILLCRMIENRGTTDVRY